MKAYKCDRCSKYFGDAPIRLGEASLINDVLHRNWNPGSIDLCEDCGKGLKVILKEWWEDRLKASGTGETK